MVFAMIALGLVALAGLADFAVNAVEETADELEGRFNELRDDPRVVDLLTSAETLASQIDDGTFARTAALIQEVEEGIFDEAGQDAVDTPTGGSSIGDIFQIYPDSNGVITGFQAGLDQLRIDVEENLSETGALPALGWQVAQDGIELHYAPDGDLETSTDSFVALLEGLTAPPAAADITLTVFDDAQDEEVAFSGDQLDFVQLLATGEGDDEIALTAGLDAYDVNAGGGNDVVTFDGLQGRTDLGDGNDSYISNAEIRFGDPDLDPQETVFGGGGDDLIRAGESSFAAQGGAGDDTLFAERTDVLAGALAQLEGGQGKDVFTFGEGARVSGGLDPDVFTFRPMLELGSAPSEITDFDPSEDALIIRLGTDYAGPGLLTISPANGGEGSLLEIDGRAALLLTRPVIDLSSIIVLQ